LIVAVVWQYHEEQAKMKQKENEQDNAMRRYIMGIMGDRSSNVAAASATPAAIPLSTLLSLNRILKRGKTSGSPCRGPTVHRSVSISSFEGRSVLKSAQTIWEPGGEKQCEQPNAYVYDVMVAAANEVMEAKKQQGLLGNGESSRTELDSHANMAVVGRHCFVIQETGRQADVSPFSPEYESLNQVDIVDAAIMYECPYTGKEVILVIQNVLYMPAMDNNLIPPFIMREAGLIVNNVPKMQMNNPTDNHHSIVFLDEEFCIPLSLWECSLISRHLHQQEHKWRSVKMSTG
jgi:hypothetical protein